MIKEVIMPKLGQTMEEGIIEKWRKKEGEKIEKGDILLEITTDKATLEVESYSSGMLKKIIHNEGETVPVAQVIAYIGEPEDEVPEIIEENPAEAVKQGGQESFPATDRTPYGVKVEQRQEEPAAGRIKASPAARRIARERKIELSLIEGTGPGGRITEKDVLGFAGRRESEVSEKGTKQISGIRRIISERMSLSKREIPHYYLTASLDMKEVIEMRKNLNQKLKGNGLKVSYNDFLIKAAALAIARFPCFNSYFEKGRIRERERVNIGLAVGLPEGIIVPVIRSADKLSFTEIVKERAKLIDRARSNKLTPDEYSGGSFTISNLGAYAIENFCAIINPPESAILAAAAITETPAALRGEIVIRPLMRVTLSLDHRIIDGAMGAEFLQKFKELVESPADMCGDIKEIKL
jgi:pyruvate dehydrogenase E2 component (dihydrolipoamide acetyltransferase)